MLSLTKPSFPDGGYWRKIHTQDIGKKLDIAEDDMIEAKDCWENFFLGAGAVLGCLGLTVQFSRLFDKEWLWKSDFKTCGKALGKLLRICERVVGSRDYGVVANAQTKLCCGGVYFAY